MKTRNDHKDISCDVMNSPIVHAKPDDDIITISKLMGEAKIIVILNDDVPLGIVTDWDIVTKAVLQKAQLHRE